MKTVSAMNSFSDFGDCISKSSSFRNVHFKCAFTLVISDILKSAGKMYLVLKKYTHQCFNPGKMEILTVSPFCRKSET